jgi:hypothetical protein
MRKTIIQRRKAVGGLLQGYALQFVLFGLLAWFVHIHPILPLDREITRSFQQNQAPWLRMTMFAISYPGSSLSFTCYLKEHETCNLVVHQSIPRSQPARIGHAHENHMSC